MKTNKSLAILFALMFTIASCSDFTNKGNDKRAQGDNSPASKPDTNTPAGPINPILLNPNEGEFSEEKMLANIGVNVIAPAVRDLALQAELLDNEVKNYCAALSTDDNIEDHEKSAQEQWKKAMLSYHFMAATPLGPLTDNGNFIGAYVYGWPLFDACGVDKQVWTLSENKTLPAAFLSTMQGLGALEYLLFESSLKTSCNPRAYPKSVEWSAKEALVKKQDRCEFAKVLTKNLIEKTQQLDGAWDVKRGNFSAKLIDGTRYKSLNEATNAVSDALYNIEKLKDLKLGKALGRHKDCASATGKCPESAEHKWSGLALRAAEAQLKGYQAVFFGSKNLNEKAFGFDDFIVSRGQPQVNDDMRAALAQAISAAKNLSLAGSLQDQINAMDPQLCKETTATDRKEALCGLHEDIRTISTTFKIEVLSLLSLRAPPTHQGDND